MYSKTHGGHQRPRYAKAYIIWWVFLYIYTYDEVSFVNNGLQKTNNNNKIK